MRGSTIYFLKLFRHYPIKLVLKCFITTYRILLPLCNYHTLLIPANFLSVQMQSTSSQIPRMYHNHTQVQCLGSSFIIWSSCTKMPAFLTITFLGYHEAGWRGSLGFIVFSSPRSRVCLNSDTITKIRRQYLPRSGVTTLWINVWMYSTLVLHPVCGWTHTASSWHAWCNPCSLLCTGGASWHLPPAVWLRWDIPALLSGTFTPSTDCAPTSPLRQVWRLKMQKRLPGHLCRGRTDAVCRDLASEAFGKRSTFCRSAHTGCKCLKIAHGFVWAHKSHAGKLSVKFLVLHCVTFSHVKEDKSASCAPLTY